MLKNKLIVKTVAVASLVAISSINLIGCTESGSEAVSIQVEQDATGGNGQKINEKEQTTKGGTTNEKTSSTGQYNPKGEKIEGAKSKYAKTFDGKVTGKTRIENGKVTEWQEMFPMDKTITPTSIVYKYKSDTDRKADRHEIHYNINGIDNIVEVYEDDSSRYFYTREPNNGNRYASIPSNNPNTVSNKTNEQIMKSVAANKAMNEVVKSMTK